MSEVISGVHLGVPISQKDGRIVVYAKAHASLNAYQPYLVNPSIITEDLDRDGVADNAGTAVTAAPATIAAAVYVGVPQKDYAAGEIAQLVIGGAGKMLVDGTDDVAAGDYIEVINAGAAGVKDSARGVGSLAAACVAQTENEAVVINVQFLGLPVQIAAS